jgi:hypothetical protein
MYIKLRKAGLAPRDIGGLTLVQAFAEFGIDLDAEPMPSVEKVDVKRIAAKRIADRTAIFDALCAEQGWKPATLVEKDVEVISGLLKAKGYDVPATVLLGYVREYVSGG